ncbi:hypothetical protein LZ30DRAFT_739153 [Colletotrichum cereale]|nr:hypothetical protein LZ30DRAFT_739153 [Colletotrichum cereale]
MWAGNFPAENMGTDFDPTGTSPSADASMQPPQSQNPPFRQLPIHRPAKQACQPTHLRTFRSAVARAYIAT